MWKIAKIIKNNNETSIISLNEFTDENIEKLLYANSIIQKINELYFIKNNFDTAYKFFDKYFIDMLKKNAFLEKDIISYNIKVFLYSGLEFIDTCEKVLTKLDPEEETRKIKKDEKFKDVKLPKGIWNFKDFITAIYDKHFSYRLCYNLRNYLQHVGTEGIAINKDKEGYHILLNKQQYINNHSGIQKKFAEELKSNGELTFDIIKLLYSYRENINSLFEMIEKHYEDKFIIDLFDANYTIFTILGKVEYDLNTQYALVDISEPIDKISINMNMQLVDIEKSKKFVSKHCKIFKMYGSQSLMPIANQFPHYLKRDNFVEVPIIIIGDRIVNEEYTWNQTHCNIGLGANKNHLSIYVPIFFSQKVQTEITDIIKRKINV